MSKGKNALDDERSILERLALRGIGKTEYARIKKIVSFDLPHPQIQFQKQFTGYSPRQVLKCLAVWRDFLQRDFLLSNFEKEQIENWLSTYEFLTWQAIFDHFISVGEPWTISWQLLPDEDGRYVYPDERVTAVHTRTKEIRTVVIPKWKLTGPKWWANWKAVLQDLKLLDFALDSYAPTKFISARKPQGWPIVRRRIMPRLYEYMAPYYRKRGHIWSEKEEQLTRDAYYPQELLVDMLGVLRLEHPDFFSRTTVGSIKSAVQNYLLEKRSSINFQKTSKIKK